MRLTGAGNLGIGTMAPGLRLEVAGDVGITGAHPLEFGRNLTKEASAGKIGYQTFTPSTLDIVGAGFTAPERRIKLWSEGGLNVAGPVTIDVGPIDEGFTVNTLKGLTFQVRNSFYTMYHATDKNKYFQMYRYDKGIQIYASGGGFGNNGNYSGSITWDGGGSWNFGSDRKLKQDIVDAESVLERALQVQVRRYRWKNSAPESKLSLGVIAQELQPLFPDLVSTQENPETKETNLAVGYSDFGLIAVKALQEFKAQHDAEMKDLKAQMAEVILLNKELRSRLDKGTASNDTGR